jgi:prepilin-type N-terminal cleavage/methylation domain-containing protein
MISKSWKNINFVKNTAGFTLIELLVVISIIGILMAVSLFGLQGARESSRDARRKADLEMIRSGLEIYKSDCNIYPASLGSPLIGSGSPTSCAVANTYISTVPSDPLSPARVYTYTRLTTSTYTLCATLEQTGTAYCVNNP